MIDILKNLLILIFILIISCPNIFSQSNSFSFDLLYLSSSKTYLYPNSPDPILRKKNLYIEDLWGFGIEYKKLFNDSKYGAGVTIEYIKKTLEIITTNTKDGYWTIPVEITGYFFIPLGLEKWKIFMGAGAGAYFGERILIKDNITSNRSNLKPGFGIHVVGGFEYYFYKNFALMAQMKFRDLYFQITNKFDIEQHQQLFTESSQFNSKINADGMILKLGIIYSFY